MLISSGIDFWTNTFNNFSIDHVVVKFKKPEKGSKFAFIEYRHEQHACSRKRSTRSVWCAIVTNQVKSRLLAHFWLIAAETLLDSLSVNCFYKLAVPCTLILYKHHLSTIVNFYMWNWSHDVNLHPYVRNLVKSCVFWNYKQHLRSPLSSVLSKCCN